MRGCVGAWLRGGCVRVHMLVCMRASVCMMLWVWGSRAARRAWAHLVQLGPPLYAAQHSCG